MQCEPQKFLRGWFTLFQELPHPQSRVKASASMYCGKDSRHSISVLALEGPFDYGK
jgi:hypothetical protein